MKAAPNASNQSHQSKTNANPVAQQPTSQGLAVEPPEALTFEDKRPEAVAQRHGVTPAQVALAWTLRHDHVMSIPKAGSREHLQQNRRAADLTLSTQDLALLEDAYPPPSGEIPLETN